VSDELTIRVHQDLRSGFIRAYPRCSGRWGVGFIVKVPIRAGHEGYGPEGEAHRTEAVGDAINFALAHERRFGLSARVINSEGALVWPMPRPNARR